MTVKQIQNKLQSLAKKDDQEILQRFFKTGPGEYGEGDVFLGIRVPVLRKVAKEYKETPIDECSKLLHSPKHEERLVALFLLIQHFQKGDSSVQKKIYDLYLKNTAYINNWDLVDLSAPQIVGAFLLKADKSRLINLAKSELLWDRRIAIVATYFFIKNHHFETTLEIANILINDNHDLIHKAVGWMLREVGKRNVDVEEAFLKTCYNNMPRTMLRYAIERFPEEKRQSYLKGLI